MEENSNCDCGLEGFCDYAHKTEFKKDSCFLLNLLLKKANKDLIETNNMLKKTFSDLGYIIGGSK